MCYISQLNKARFIKDKNIFTLLWSVFNPFGAGGRQRRNMSHHVRAVLYNHTAPLP